MKYLEVSAVFILLISFGCTNVKLNSFQRREELNVDSLRVADSLRVVDSIKTHDSLVLARYAESDKKITEVEIYEKKIEESVALMKEQAALESYESDVGFFEPREIVIEDDNEYAGAIDSIQNKIDSLTQLIYESDERYVKMKDFTCKDKKAYMKFLLKNHFKDTSEVLSCCERMYTMLELEYEKLQLIIKTQEGNSRGFINLYIRKAKQEMGEIGRFMLLMSSDVPDQIMHEQNKKWEL